MLPELLQVLVLALQRWSGKDSGDEVVVVELVLTEDHRRIGARVEHVTIEEADLAIVLVPLLGRLADLLADRIAQLLAILVVAEVALAEAGGEERDADLILHILPLADTPDEGVVILDLLQLPLEVLCDRRLGVVALQESEEKEDARGLVEVGRIDEG